MDNEAHYKYILELRVGGTNQDPIYLFSFE